LQVKKKQDHILWTLESKQIDHEPIDIADPGRAKDRNMMRERLEEKLNKVIPPQIFNEDKYIGVRID
jgi:hypothetical protein